MFAITINSDFIEKKKYTKIGEERNRGNVERQRYDGKQNTLLK